MRDAILIVDGDLNLGCLMMGWLHQAGYDALYARGSRLACTHLWRFRGRIAAALVDIDVEANSGFEFVEKIGLVRPCARIVLMSEIVLDPNICTFFGVHTFLQKPFGVAELISSVEWPPGSTRLGASEPVKDFNSVTASLPAGIRGAAQEGYGHGPIG